MQAANSNISQWADKVSQLLPSHYGLALDDLKQEIALFIFERTEMLKACQDNHLAYVIASVKNYLIDAGNNASVVAVPRLRSEDSDLTKNMKLSLMEGQVSMNDETGGYDYETILPCQKYEQFGLWKKIRNVKILDWITENAPLLDFLLEESKDTIAAPAVWNSKPLVRAFMGTDEVKKMLNVFGYDLSPDERLYIEESMFRKFMHAKKAKNVKSDEPISAPNDFFMSM